jgi:hypothetical protein
VPQQEKSVINEQNQPEQETAVQTEQESSLLSTNQGEG